MPEADDIVQFTRTRDYVFVQELGRGACGRTVVLHDDLIDERFVCKKYSPHDETQRERLFGNFVRETKILHQLHHENVVRVFSYYLYPDRFAGYILMELIDGQDVDGYLSDNPEMVNEVFMQTVAGFSYLEANGILHRDIRSQNLLVRADGVMKIIDFGFGKQVQAPEDFDKSVSLNWWCELPEDFKHGHYNFATEVYFVGKLFERIIQENGMGQFKYPEILRSMCELDPANRVSSFTEVERALQGDRFLEIDFTEDERETYQHFADALVKQIAKIRDEPKYQDDIDKAITALDSAYRDFMLEELVPNAALVIRCFIKGEYSYRKKGLPVWTVKDFLHMMKAVSPEKRRIVMSNLYTRLDAVERYCPPSDDEIPF